MVTYSEPIQDEKILERLGDVKSAAIIGCPVCANICLAFLRDLPIHLLGKKASAMLKEIPRMRGILEERGIRVKKKGKWIICLDQRRAIFDNRW